ncbi:Filament-forming protein [Coemansia sp. RSA 2424]|nr:Filament-forming protein [Coemansia sp. RSA 2424]
MEHELSELLALPTPVVSAVLSKLGYVADVEEDSEVGQFVARLQTKLRTQQASEDSSNGDDAESQKAQLQYENTRLENEVHRLNKQLGQVKSALESSANETRSAQAELQATKALLDSAKAEVQEQQAQSSSHSAAESQLRSQVSQLRDEKRQLLEQLGERRDQLDARATECQRAQESLSELRQQRARDQEELARLRSQTSVSDVSEHMLRQSLDLAKSQVAWLDEELGRTQTELQQAKADLARATTAGRADAARLRADTESQAEVIAELQTRATNLDRSLRGKMEAERVAREERAEQAEQFRREMAAQKKLCEEWEKTTEAAKAHVRSVEDALREVEDRQRQADVEAAESQEAHEQQLDAMQRQLADAAERISELEEKLRTANHLLSESTNTSRGGMLLSPTASAAARLQGTQPRLNITQLYTEKTALEDQLRNADAEIACLRESMEQILAELEDRAPIIAAEREEHQQLLADADRIAQDLATVRQEHAQAARTLRDIQRDRDLARRQLTAEQQQTKDQARQITRLLRAVEETRGGGRPLPETRDDHATDRDYDDEQWLSDVDRVISQKLVTFTDIVELVAQNQRLLRTTRELAAQVAHEEQVRRAESEDEVKQALEQAETMLDRLTIELESTKSRMGVISRERDMLKTMKSDEPEKTQTPPPRPPPSSSSYSSLPVAAKAEAAESSSSEDPLAKLQADYDLYRSETRKTRVLLERDAGTLQQEVSDLRVRAAKAEAQTQFDAERIQLFASDLSARQKEIDHLRMATSRLHAQVESYERQLDAQSQSQAAERAELSALRRASTLLEAERDSLQHNEQRWRKEEQRLVAERASLTQILENTTRMRDEWQRAADDQVVQVKDRLEAARKDADEARAELRVSRDALDRAQFRADAEVQELRATVQARDERVALLQAQLVEAKDRIASVVAASKDIEVARDALQRQVAALEARVQSQDELVARAKGQGQPVSRESLLAVQLQDARSQLDALHSELETTATRAEDYRQLSTASEKSLAQLTDTYDQYKAEQERSLGEQRRKSQRLEKDLADAVEALTACRRDLEVSVSAEKELRVAQKDDAARVRQLEGVAEQREAALEALRQDMARHEGVAQNLQEQYEREIVAHAKDIEATLLAREKLRDSQKALAAVTAELQTSKQAAEHIQADAARASERATADVQAAEAQLAKFKRQNSLLLAHLESIGHQVPDISVDPEQVAENMEETTTDEGGSLREVIVYLRRERDLVAAQLEVAQQESQRWRQQSTHAQKMLDEVRQELLQYAPASESKESGGAANRQGDIEQAQLLRESNSVLRSELTAARARLRDIEADLVRVKDQEVPQLRSANSALTAELGAARAQVDQLTGMCDHWKQRHEKVLAKYQMIEPEEYEALKVENEKLKADCSALRRQVADLQRSAEQAVEQKSAAQNTRVRTLQADIARLHAQIEAQLRELDAERQKSTALESDAALIREQLEKASADAMNSETGAQASKAKYEKLHGAFQKLRQQSVEKLEQSNKAIKAHEATIQGLSEQVEALQTGSADAGALQRVTAQVAALAEEKDHAVAAHRALAEELQSTQSQLNEARERLQHQQTLAAPGDNESAGNAMTAAAAAAETEQLRARLVDAEAKVKDYETQLEQLKARALKYARDNKVLQSRATELEKQLAEIKQQGDSSSPLQAQLEEAKRQLTEAEAKIEVATVNAKKSAELRSKLQISRANKRADDLEKQVAALEAKLEETSGEGASSATLKRPTNDAADGPAKKAHVSE